MEVQQLIERLQGLNLDPQVVEPLIEKLKIDGLTEKNRQIAVALLEEGLAVAKLERDSFRDAKSSLEDIQADIEVLHAQSESDLDEIARQAKTEIDETFSTGDPSAAPASPLIPTNEPIPAVIMQQAIQPAEPTILQPAVLVKPVISEAPQAPIVAQPIIEPVSSAPVALPNVVTPTVSTPPPAVPSVPPTPAQEGDIDWLSLLKEIDTPAAPAVPGQPVAPVVAAPQPPLSAAMQGVPQAPSVMPVAPQTPATAPASTVPEPASIV